MSLQVQQTTAEEIKGFGPMADPTVPEIRTLRLRHHGHHDVAAGPTRIGSAISC